uniref:Uncharacterized protein n=1 Tax=Timema poppense TaxID=170557 RepID=A0A7R9D314_TIMPO|nr:unnamed protein product [Timema poppensis]
MGKTTSCDKLAQLPTNFETEVDPLSDEPCIPENGLEGEPQTFLCPMCCEKQFSLVDLQQHISRYIWGSLKCPVCEEVCVGLEILAVHLDEHHSYQEMLVPEIRLWTNEDKVSDTAEESVNVSCGDVTDQSTDSVSSDIGTNDNYYFSVMADSSCAPDTHMSGVEQNSATSSENVSTSSTCEIENCVEALRGVNSNRKLCCRKCGIYFLNERAYTCSVVTLFRSSLSGQAEKILPSLTSDAMGGASDAVECTPINKFKKNSNAPS